MNPSSQDPAAKRPETPTPQRLPVGDTAGIGLAAGLVAAVGLIAGGLAFLAGEANYDRFQPSEEASAQAYDFTELNRQKKQAESWNGALAYGVLGAALGLGMGLAGGLARRPARPAIGAALIGLVLGGLAGAGMSYGLVPIHYVNKDPASTDLRLPLMIHAGIWVPIGLVAGLAFGLGRGGGGDAVRCGIGGALGAVFGTLAYELGAGIAFPFARSTQPIAVEWPARLVAHAAIALGTGLGIALIGRPGPGPAPKPAPAPPEV